MRGPVPPRGGIAFTAPRTPLPLRSDGDFRTTVEVTALTQQPVGGQAAAPARLDTTPLAGTPPPAGTTVEPVEP